MWVVVFIIVLMLGLYMALSPLLLSWKQRQEGLNKKLAQLEKRHYFFARVGWYQPYQKVLFQMLVFVCVLAVVLFVLARLVGYVSWSGLTSLYMCLGIMCIPLLTYQFYRWRFSKLVRYSWMSCLRLLCVFITSGMTLEQALGKLHPFVLAHYPVLAKPITLLLQELAVTADPVFAWERLRQRISLPQDLAVTFVLQDSAKLGAGSMTVLQNALQQQTATYLVFLESEVERDGALMPMLAFMGICLPLLVLAFAIFFTTISPTVTSLFSGS